MAHQKISNLAASKRKSRGKGGREVWRREGE